MHDYSELKTTHGRKVSQTIDSPIMIMDVFELGDAFAALAVVLVFGVILYEWLLMLLALAVVLIALPAIRRRSEKGVFLHVPYKCLGIKLPGIINPGRNKKYSD